MIPYSSLEAAARRLLAAYDVEESEHGFPFNMELREAHRELAALLAKESAPEPICQECRGTDIPRCPTCGSVPLW